MDYFCSLSQFLSTSLHTNVINATITVCLSVTFSWLNRLADYDIIWYGHSLNPEEGYRLLLI